MHELRNPKQAAPSSNAANPALDSGFKGILSRTTGNLNQHHTPSHNGLSLMDNSRRLTTEVPFIDLLMRRDNFDVRMIEA